LHEGLRRHQPAGQRIINSGKNLTHEPVAQPHLGFLVTALLFLPERAATFLFLRIDVAGLVNDAQHAPIEISRNWVLDSQFARHSPHEALQHFNSINSLRDNRLPESLGNHVAAGGMGMRGGAVCLIRAISAGVRA
jgi:hypothetical protein